MKQKLTDIINNIITLSLSFKEKLKLFIYDIKYFFAYTNYDSKRNCQIIRMLERDMNKLEAWEEFRHDYCHREKSFGDYCRYRNAYNKGITKILKNIQQYICDYQKIDEELELPIYDLIFEKSQKKTVKRNKAKVNNKIRAKRRA